MRKFISLIFTVFFLTSQSSYAFDFDFFNKKRPYIYIVGSSTISPFTAAISEEFARTQNLNNIKTPTPVVESTGTRSGFQIFCGGVGYKYPDFINASRPIDLSEIANCNKNGIKEIVEIKLGYDGIILGNARGSKKIKLTKEQIFLALAQKVIDKKSGKLINNPYTTWNQIDSALPKTKILIYGPPSTSGTRDIFAELVMEESCMYKREFISAIGDHDLRKKQCETIRNDGVFIESGENDNLLVQNLKDNPGAIGILGFHFLVINRDSIQAVTIDNIEPTFASIESKKYELSRPLFIYFKKEHLNLVPDIREFLKEIVNSETIGQKGYLHHGGLIAMSDLELKKVQETILAIQ